MMWEHCTKSTDFVTYLLPKTLKHNFLLMHQRIHYAKVFDALSMHLCHAILLLILMYEPHQRND